MSPGRFQTTRRGCAVAVSLAHSDQLQVLDFLNRDMSDFRAGWLPASH